MTTTWVHEPCRAPMRRAYYAVRRRPRSVHRPTPLPLVNPAACKAAGLAAAPTSGCTPVLQRGKSCQPMVSTFGSRRSGMGGSAPGRRLQLARLPILGLAAAIIGLRLIDTTLPVARSTTSPAALEVRRIAKLEPRMWLVGPDAIPGAISKVALLGSSALDREADRPRRSREHGPPFGRIAGARASTALRRRRSGLSCNEGYGARPGLPQ